MFLLLQRGDLDPAHDGGEVRQHFLIPEADHANLLIRQSVRARLIPLLLLVVDGSIHLTTELSGRAVEVQDETSERMLSPKWSPASWFRRSADQSTASASVIGLRSSFAA